ncbi:mitochondrial import receptor subunit tom9-2 [Quercus suber]|uniref:Mitochondrial import receptor subunit tom9-2 n=1 Tax=Quercus suber TaxID=58331 RepID=A0AAW0LIA4_QUESU
MGDRVHGPIWRSPSPSIPLVISREKRVTHGKESEHSLISRASRNVSQLSIVIHTKRTTSEAAVVSKKLLRSIGKAAWIAGSTFLILAVPLIIEMDRDQQLTEIEL